MTARGLRHRRAVAAALGLALLAGVTGWAPLAVPWDGAPGAASVRAADTDLTLVTDALYDVDPEAGVVHVTVDITARNNRAETVTRRFYFDRAFLAVLPGVTDLAISGSTGPSVTATARAADHTMLRITFGERLYNGAETTFRLTFDLPDPGAPPERDVRVGDSLVSFPLWAFASDGATGSRVGVRFPPEYDIAFETGTFDQRETADDGSTVFRTGALAEPLAFFAYVVAEREGETASRGITASVQGEQVPLRIRAWADDPAWADRVSRLLSGGLPLLGSDIGLSWPRGRAEPPLLVEEAISRTAGGYAGLFDPAEGRIEIAYWASDGIVLHEAAHAWFNGALLADRWANEGFAAYYAARAAAVLGVTPDTPVLTEELAAAAVPLNAWGALGSQDPATDAYGFAAASTLAGLVAERAGDDILRRVWAKARAGIPAWADPDRPADAAPGTAAPPDWRGLLDLLEEETGTAFDDLWETWVLRPEDRALLADRADARLALARTEALAGDWALPPQVRAALRAWQFDTAEDILSDARTVLAQRTAVEVAAERAGLELPDTLRTLFERGALADASQVAAAQLSAVEVVDAAAGDRPESPDPITVLGLVGSDPDATLAGAAAALAEGDTERALVDAQVAQRTWIGAWEEGRRRALLLLAVTAGVALIVLTITGRRRGTERRRGMATRVGG